MIVDDNDGGCDFGAKWKISEPRSCLIFCVSVIYNGALEKEIECDKFTCRCTQFVGFFFSQDQSYLIKMNIYKCRKEGVLYSRMLKYCEDPIQDDILCVCLNIA